MQSSGILVLFAGVSILNLSSLKSFYANKNTVSPPYPDYSILSTTAFHKGKSDGAWSENGEDH
jgi:hypothetical protein